MEKSALARWYIVAPVFPGKIYCCWGYLGSLNLRDDVVGLSTPEILGSSGMSGHIEGGEDGAILLLQG